MADDTVREPCELNCIMQLIDPCCDKCRAWYEYVCELDDSELDWYLREDRGEGNG